MKNILPFILCAVSVFVSGCSPDGGEFEESRFAAVRIVRPSVDGAGAARPSGGVFADNVKLLKNNKIMQAVASRMTARAKDAVLSSASKKDMSVDEILLEKVSVKLNEKDGTMLVGFNFPDQKLSADLANACAAEFVSQSHGAAVKSIMDSVDELREKIAGQEKKLKEIDERLLAFRVEHGADISEETDGRNRTDLRDLNAALESAKSAFEKAKNGGEAMVKNAQKNLDAAAKSLSEKRKDISEQGRLAADYRAVERERFAAEAVHAGLIEAMNARVRQINSVEAPAVIIRKASM